MFCCKKYSLCTRSVKKIRWIFIFLGLCTFDFRVFFSYVGTLVPNVCSQFQQYSIFCLFVRGIKVRSVLRVLAIFCCRKKWIKEYASNFVWKMESSAQKHVKCWKWHTVSVLWVKVVFTSGRRSRRGKWRRLPWTD